MNWMRITTITAVIAVAMAALCVPAFGQVSILDPSSGDDGNVPVTVGTVKVKGNSDQTGEQGITVPGTGEGAASAGPDSALGGILKVSCIGGVLGGGSTNAGLGASLGECDTGGGSGNGPGDGDGGNGDGDGGNGDGDGTDVVPDLPPPLDCLDVALEPTVAVDLTCDGAGTGNAPTTPNNTGNDDDNADGAGSTGANGGNGDGDGSATSCVDQAANLSGPSDKGPLLGGLALGLLMFALGALSRRRRGLSEAV